MVTAGPTTDGGAFFLERERLSDLFDQLRVGDRRLIGPTPRDGTIVLDELTDVEQLPVGIGLANAPGRSSQVDTGSQRCFDYPPGPTSWKRWTFPPRTTQLQWPTDDQEPAPRAPDPEPSPACFLGVRACEIAAIGIQDRVLRAGPIADADYAARRADNLVVAVECAVAGGTCFCTSMGTGPELTDGFDLGLSELDDGFVVRVGSPAGARLVESMALAPASGPAVAQAATAVRAVRDSMGVPMAMAGVPARLKSAFDSPRWADIADRCLACTNCTLVCPTCFCTSVDQRSDLDGGQATTERRWDSCFTFDFARIAGGNFRPQTKDRYRQWLTHKFGTWWDQFGTSGCVGCGRCITWCPVGIDVREELMAIAGPAVPSAPVPLPVISSHATPSVDGEWSNARVTGVTAETSDVMTLRLATDDERLLGGQPGQFVMAALPAFASPPISISRFNADSIELTVRSVGAATAAICALSKGDSVALRGPLGRGWPVELVNGRDVVVVAGGIGLAPLRPLLDELVRRRDRVGRIQLAYGARTPMDRLFVAELDRLVADDLIEVSMIVDRAGPEWLGRVGVVTQVIDRTMCSCDRSVAFVCGPERMMQATAATLGERGIPPERVLVTLERHMECGVGLCGHCQLGPFFVCRDGPVFSHAELGPAFSVDGL